MNLLLDTHILIWALSMPEKIESSVKQLIENPENNIYVSNLCFWEISIKYSKGKIDINKNIPEDFLTASKKGGFIIKNLTEKEAATLYRLTGNYHKDPFDRMMIWQAICNNFTFVTDDKQVKKYVADGLKTL
jgi:PIN domain nuclease of toxin-antitoxin system